ncbi:MAG: hypothetical protein H7A08_09035 [Oceanospirillaceae bacterium]|nr:hypothetical protein [Oceanospirillaceae bacterium]MCP5349886.1 hypothetical protein [Oceanospirillaceae bacterium]
MRLFFAQKVSFDDEQLYSLCHGNAADTCWNAQEKLVLNTCDALQQGCSIPQDLWQQLTGVFSDNAILEIIMLAGFYRTVSYLTNSLQLTNETYAKRFPAA